MKFLNDRLNQYRINPANSDKCNQLKWNTGFKVNMESFDGKAKHRQRSQYNAYTDGSKLDGKTGAGLVIYGAKTELTTCKLRLPDGTTVFQAEVAAIAEAAATLTGMCNESMKYVKIFVDSQAALAAIANPYVTSCIVAEAIEKLNTLADLTRSVTLVWIPAHKGYEGNERADALAKEGSMEDDRAFMRRVNMPQATVKREIKDQIYNEWRKEWSELNMANHSKSFYSGPNPGKARFVYKLARLELGRFARIITGHNNLNFFQDKIGLARDPTCRFCREGQETITHLTNVCPRFQVQRREILLDQPPTAEMKWSVRGLLNFSYVPGINEAYEGTWADLDPPDGASDELELTAALDCSTETNSDTGVEAISVPGWLLDPDNAL